MGRKKKRSDLCSTSDHTHHSLLNQEWLSMENGLKRLDANELKSWIQHYQTTLPGMHSVWLRDFISRINNKLQDIPDRDPVLQGYPVNYPLCLLGSDVRYILENAMKTADHDVLERIFEQCVQAMLTLFENRDSCHGYRLIIQILASVHPDITLNSLSKYLELMKHNQTKQDMCLLIMWATGQCGYHDLSCGLRVWLAVMVPTLGLQSLSDYAVNYITQLFQMHTDVQTTYLSTPITFRDYFPILDIIMSGSSSLSGSNQRKLLLLYPKMKEIAFGDERNDGRLKNFFPSYLARIKSSASHSFTQELLSCLVTCLERDAICFGVWEKMQNTHMEQSSIFINYLARNWDIVFSRLDIKRLQKTLNKFQNIPDKGLIGYQRFRESLQNLRNQMTKKETPTKETNQNSQSSEGETLATSTNSSSSMTTLVVSIVFGVFIGVICYLVYLKKLVASPEPSAVEVFFSSVYKTANGVVRYSKDKIVGPEPQTYTSIIKDELQTGFDMTMVYLGSILNQLKDILIFAWNDYISVWIIWILETIDTVFNTVLAGVVLFFADTLPHLYHTIIVNIWPYVIMVKEFLLEVTDWLYNQLVKAYIRLSPYLNVSYGLFLRYTDVFIEKTVELWYLLVMHATHYWEQARVLSGEIIESMIERNPP